jgi:hypothetical protein
MDVGAVVGTVVDGVGTDVAVTPVDPASGDDDTGTVEPGKSVINDAAGVADSKTGAVELAVVDVGEIAGIVGIVAAADVEGVVAGLAPWLTSNNWHRRRSA